MVLLKTIKLVVTGISNVACRPFCGAWIDRYCSLEEFVRHFYFSKHLLEGVLEIVKSES